MQKLQKFAPILVLTLIVVLGGWWYLRHRAIPQSSAANNISSSTPIDLSSISTTTTIGQYTITPVYGSAGGTAAASAPDYTTPIPYSGIVAADVKTAIEAQFTDIKKTLALNPNDYDSWMRLGTLHKIAGDYSGAISIWSYAAMHWNDYVAYANLGNLYMNFVKNYAKAEADYKKAIALRPDFIEGYGTLASLYSSFGYKGTMTAAQVLAEGLKANPNNPTLLQLQSQLTASTTNQ